MPTRFPLLGARRWLMPAIAFLVLATPSLAARPEIKAQGQQISKRPSYLAQHGLAPAEGPDAPVAEPSDAARAALERLRAAGEGRWSIDWDATKGTPITVYGGRVGPFQGTPQAAARAFLRDYADLFNLGQGAALKHETVSTSRGGTRVLFVQRHQGLAVYGGSITVLVDRDGFIRMASGGFHQPPARTSVMGIAADQALKGVLRRVDPSAGLTRAVSPAIPAAGMPADTALEYAATDAVPHGLLGRARIRPAWFPTADGFRMIWAADVALGDRIHEFRVFVDGESGEPLYAEMLSHTTHESIRVYTENPNTTSLSVESIVDADKPVSGGDLVGAFTSVINDQTADINDGNYLHTTDPNDPTVDLNFDEQNVFYHNNLIRQFFVDLNGGPDLGGFINLDTNFMTSVVHLRSLVCVGGDNDGLSCTSNANCPGGSCDINNDTEGAFFSGSTDQTLFGHGSFHTGGLLASRDYALEDSVVYHEYSHRVNNNVAGFGGAVYGGAMNEGVADYWSATIVDDKYIGEYLNPDAAVGDYSGWLGFYGFIRSMENDRTFSNLCDNIFVTDGCEVHSDGEIYAGVLWDLRQALIAALGKAQGVSTADDLILEHVFNMSPDPPPPGDDDDFIEGRNAMLTADSTLFGGVYECLIWQVFANREIGNGSSPTVPPTTSTALPAQCTGTATVEFSRPFYTCAAPDSAILTVTDAGGGAVTTIDVSTGSGDSETLALSWAAGVGTTAAFDVQVGAFTKNNGIIEVAAENENILAAYTDNSPVQITFASANVDCTPDLQFVSSRVFNGSCDADDPFLDGGEAALLEVRLRLETGIDLSGQPLDVSLTLVSNNGNVTVSAPSSIVPVASISGTGIDVVGTWAVEAAAGVSAGETVDFDVLVGGPGITGSQSAISFTEVLEQDLNYVAQSTSFDFVSGEQDFFTAQNGSTGTEGWFHQTHNCAGPPNAGYWHMGGTNCGTYSILDATWLISPYVRIQNFDAKYPSRLTNLRFQHRVDFHNSARGSVWIETDQFDLADSLQFLPVVYEDTENTPGFVQEDIDLIAGLPAGLVGTHGWYRFRWLVNADARGFGGPVDTEGWYVDNVEIHWEEPTAVADANAPASCAPAAVLDFDSHSVLDGSGNSDGVVDPGETIGLPVTLGNSGNQTGQAISGTLSSDRPDIITITDATATFPSIIPLDSETSDGPHFEFAVSLSAACATIVNFTVVLDHNGAAAASTVMFPVRIGSLVPAAGVFFADDFEGDTGMWTVNPDLTDDATTGVWERVASTPYWYDDDPANGNPTQPNVDFDPGSPTGRSYLTQNGAGAEQFFEHDIDNGKTTLQSSAFDLSLVLEPTVSYARWLYNRDGNLADAFLVEISNDNGGSWTTIETVAEQHGTTLNIVTNQWIYKTWRILDFLPITNQMKFRFIAQDQSGQILEAQVDGFEIRASEAICDVPLIPGEVSPPGAATPLTLTSPLPGLVLLVWEPTVNADTYRVVTGNLADLDTFGGVTASSAAPLQCGIAVTTAGYVAAPGSVFYVVQGEGIDGVGTAGSGRNPDLTCP